MKTWHLIAIGVGVAAAFFLTSKKADAASLPPVVPSRPRKTPDEIVKGDRFEMIGSFGPAKMAPNTFVALENPSFVESVGLAVLAMHEPTGGEGVIPIAAIARVL